MMKENIIEAHTNCIIALKDLTPMEVLEVLDSIRYGLIKSHNIDRPNPFPELSWNDIKTDIIKNIETFANLSQNMKEAYVRIRPTTTVLMLDYIINITKDK